MEGILASAEISALGRAHLSRAMLGWGRGVRVGPLFECWRLLRSQGHYVGLGYVFWC